MNPTYSILSLFAQPVELRSVIGEFAAEVLDPVKGLLLFLRNKFLLGQS